MESVNDRKECKFPHFKGTSFLLQPLSDTGKTGHTFEEVTSSDGFHSRIRKVRSLPIKETPF